MPAAHDPSDPADALRALEHRRTRALVERDLPTLEALHAPEYELITPAGRVFSRERYLAAIAREPFYSGWEAGEIAVRLGRDSAVLRYPARLSFPSGGVLRCWHLDTYERRDGAWQAVWSQATQMPAEPGPTEALAAAPGGPTVRPVEPGDLDGWRPLWDGYNAFYGRSGATALDEAITRRTWGRFFDPAEPVFARVAVEEGRLVGLAHALYHRSTTRVEPVCYLQDLFTLPQARGRGVGRALIEAVARQARADGVQRLYWQTHEGNAAGRRLYDQVARHQGFIVYAREA